MIHLFKYHFRSIFVRWRSTVTTIAGLALVIAVFVMVQSLAVGIERFSANTGDPHNLMIARQGALSEATSVVTREQFNIIRYLPGIAKDASGTPIASGDTLIIINLPRRDGTGTANVMLRGIAPAGRTLRKQVSLVHGRWFESGHREVVVSQRLAKRFANLGIGDTFTQIGQTFTVVGIFDGQRTAFDSEVWLDADEARSAYDRPDYSSMLVRAESIEAIPEIRKAIEADRRLKVKATPEIDYYKEQTRSAGPIRWLANGLAIVMSVGAIFSAMNTLYASVGARTREIGTLRVLGFRRRSILLGFLLEGAMLAAVGGLIGCAIAYFGWNGVSTGTFGQETFTEVVFEFQVTPILMAKAVIFAIIVGLVGSFLPSLRAARLPVISSLKAA